MDKRVIALIDMDCFYVQVEQRDQPHLWGKPTAVVQYNQWKKGSIIAVGYEARSRGVKRGMRGEEALGLCTDLNLVSVPTQRAKADLTKYRQASAQVFKVLAQFDKDLVVERASIDEAYIDLSPVVEEQLKKVDFRSLRQSPSLSGSEIVPETDFPTSYVLLTSEIEEAQREFRLKEFLQTNCVYDVDEMRLALGARIVERIRSEILQQTQFHCSAGIARNKTLAKLICSRHKPKQQTILSDDFVHSLLATTDICTVRNLGGKLGDVLVQKFQAKTLGDLATIPVGVLDREFGEKTGHWLRDLARGIDRDPVTARDLAKSIGCSKNFFGKEALRSTEAVQRWLTDLTDELAERLTADQLANHRTAKTLTAGVQWRGEGVRDGASRQTPLHSYGAAHIAAAALNLLRPFNTATATADGQWYPPVVNLNISAAKFLDSVELQSHSITEFMKPKNRPISAEVKLDNDSPYFAVMNGSEPAGETANEVGCHHEQALEESAETETDLVPTDNWASKVGDSLGESKRSEVATSFIGAVCERSAVNEVPSTSFMIDSTSAVPGDNSKTGLECVEGATTLEKSPSGNSVDLFDSDHEAGGLTELSSQKSKNHELSEASNNCANVTFKNRIVENLESVYYPENFNEIDQDFFKSLPFSVQFELKSFYRKKGTFGAEKKNVISRQKSPRKNGKYKKKRLTNKTNLGAASSILNFCSKTD